jgi:hypothetical protein
MRRSLTNDEMLQIKGQTVRVKNEEITFSQFILWFYEGICGVSPDADSIDPKEFQIPESQWKEIASWLQGTIDIYGHDGILKGTWNPAFAWMNSGPSGYVVHPKRGHSMRVENQ